MKGEECDQNEQQFDLTYACNNGICTYWIGNLIAQLLSFEYAVILQQQNQNLHSKWLWSERLCIAAQSAII